MYRMKTLSERPVKSTEATDYFTQVFTNQSKADGGKTNERAMSKTLALFDGQGQGSELSSAKGTAFGLLNAVTEFIDHDRRARSIDHRLDSAWFGPGSTIKHKALDQALLMIA